MRLFSMVISLVVLLSGCGGGGGGGSKDPAPPVQATLEELIVSSSHVSIPVGQSAGLTVKGLYSDDSIVDLTGTVTWSVSDVTIATVDSAGVVTGVKAGSVTVTACLGSTCEDISVDISGASLDYIEVSAESSRFPNGRDIQFTATGIFSDGVKLDITDDVTWTSSDNSVAEPVSGSALFDTKTIGSFTATATFGFDPDTVTGINTIEVTSATLSNLFISPSGTHLIEGELLQLKATGVYSDNSVLDLTGDVTWTSSAAGIATVSEGLVTGVSVGDFQISIEYDSKTGTADFTVTDESIESITITPGSVSLAIGTIAQLTANAVYTDSYTKNITSDVIWISSDTSIVTVDNSDANNGLLIATGTGSATVQACLQGVCSEISVSVSSAVLTSITITSNNDNVPQQSLSYFTATGHFSDGVTDHDQDITNAVYWSTGDNSVAVISNQTGYNGLLFALSNGTTEVIAVYGAQIVSEDITVTDITLTSFKITPEAASDYLPLVIDTESTVTLTLYGVYSDTTEFNFSPVTTWFSLSDEIITISNESGEVTPVSTGNGGVIAIAGNLGIVQTISVLQPVTSIEITSVSYNATVGVEAVIVEKGTGALMTAQATFNDSTTGDVTNLVTWTSVDTDIASFPYPAAPYGGISGILQGDTTLSAALNIYNTAEINSNSLDIAVVELVSIDRFRVDATSVADVVQFYAVGNFTSGDTDSEGVLNNDRVTWSSDNSSVITFSDDAGSEGLATIHSAGTSNITAVVGSISLTFPITTE